MSLEISAPRTRRALLAAALGAAAASVASALGRPAPVRAGSDGDVVLGADNTATSTTKISSAANIGIVLWGHSNGPDIGVRGSSNTGAGVHGSSISGYGVQGSSESGHGVTGGSTSGNGVHALSDSGTGVWGGSSSTSGVHGYCGSGVGVRGEATTGIGVIGTATTGTAGRFESASGAIALQTVNGRVVVGGRSGRVRITAGKSSYDVTVPGGLAGTPLCFANLMNYRSGVHVAAVRPNYPSSGRLRIYLSKTLTTAAYVSWLVLG